MELYADFDLMDNGCELALERWLEDMDDFSLDASNDEDWTEILVDVENMSDCDWMIF